MVGIIARELLVLGTSCRLVAYQVGPCAAQTGGTCSLMRIHHNMVFGSLGYAVEVVVVHYLRVVVLASRNDVAHIAALYGVVAVAVHQLISRLKVALVVHNRTRGLVVHHQLHALRVGIVVESLDVEVGIRCLEVEHMKL